MPYHVNELAYVFDNWDGWAPGIIVGPNGPYGYATAVKPDRHGPSHTHAKEDRLRKLGSVPEAERDKATEATLKMWNKLRLKKLRQSKKAKGTQRKTRKSKH